MASEAATEPQMPGPDPAETATVFPDGAPQRRFSRHTYGALDLGTNNCRLLIARPAETGFVVIDAFSRVVRLGEGLGTSGRISDGAIERALGALSVCAEKLRRRRVTLARSVATEACRRAVNGRQFVERVRRETGICLEIISPEEEARLAMLGCHRLLEPGDGPALIFDIGGGSTELVLIDTDGDAPRIKCWWSAPWGVASLTESESQDLVDPAERRAAYGRMKERVRHAFRRFAELLPKYRHGVRLMGTSGTVTTLASVHLALPSYDRRQVDGLMMPAEAMRRVSGMLSRMSHEERAALPCIGTERADLVVAGCAILEAIMDMWPAETLGVADRGIREGILRSLMARDGYDI
ncbi:MAG: exopolyphosphatase / guanosine-5-triphosphate,3-diphosphate pyrophosphatase [Sphingomonadales bacterium]|jgi:exopolyphosphatase/guanosine-5'-triphosphate,3'-diphosphate pyrophosphatase|nr:exopolyphosphatase / guanosine-5-triphosphate,3-diphosphate pyrophosphatase [Sphingomonadales bacterium]